MNGIERLNQLIDWSAHDDYQRGLQDAYKVFMDCFSESLCVGQTYYVVCYEGVANIPYIKKLKLFKITGGTTRLTFHFTENLTDDFTLDTEYVKIAETRKLMGRIFTEEFKAKEHVRKNAGRRKV